MWKPLMRYEKSRLSGYYFIAGIGRDRAFSIFGASIIMASVVIQSILL